MERFKTLTDLKAGKVPADFAAGLGEHGPEMEGLVLSMVNNHEEERWGCEEAKKTVEEIIGAMRQK
jgi:hypothetical protein